MEYYYYLLKRDDVEMIVCVATGNDPLHGNGSWDLAAGPFTSWEAAENAARPTTQTHEHGQGMIEYLLMAAMIMITIVFVWGAVGASVIEKLGPGGVENIIAGLAAIK